MDITAGVLLRRTKLTDTSLILTWFTLEHGKMKTVAKGARRPKSPFAGKLDLFFQCELQFARSHRSELHSLREVMLLNPFEGIRRSYRHTQMAAYFAELTELLTEPDHAVPEIYDLLLRAFDYLNRQPPTRRALLHFEAELARVLGLRIDSSPAQALGRVAGRLPAGRAELMDLG
jgi:DNA repair protein RecO (recombination protein O)